MSEKLVQESEEISLEWNTLSSARQVGPPETHPFLFDDN